MFQMNWSRLRDSSHSHVFKGSQLVTSVLERHHQHFRSRAAALKFCRQLFNDGVIKAVFGATRFEDSVQLYTWADSPADSDAKMTSSRSNFKMTSYLSDKSPSPPKSYGYSSADVTVTKRELTKQKDSIRPIDVTVTRESGQASGYNHDVNGFFRELQNGVANDHDPEPLMNSQSYLPSYRTAWNLKRASTASSESSVAVSAHQYGKHRDRTPTKPSYTPSSHSTHSHSREHDVIPEESLQKEASMPGGIDRIDARAQTSTEYDGTSSFPRSVTTDTSAASDVYPMTAIVTSHSQHSQRQWTQEFQTSYSDNEKQLIEQMRLMKKEHSHILRTYEERINKLMAKMHELRTIAEMLENSSTKSSPYAMINSRGGVLNFLSKLVS